MTDSVTDPNLNRDEHDDTGGVKGKRVKSLVWDPLALNYVKEPLHEFTSFEAQKITLSSGTDTTITFAQTVGLVRLKNFDATNVVLVKNGAINSNTDTTADWVGVAPTTNVPNEDYFPYATTTIHLRSAGASSVVVTGFF